MTVISNNGGSLAHYPTSWAKNYNTKTFLEITMTIVRGDLFQTSSAIVQSILSTADVAAILTINWRQLYKTKKNDKHVSIENA